MTPLLILTLPFFVFLTPEPPEPDLPAHAIGSWPDDGWTPPPMHTYAQQQEIMRNNIHICEITDKGPCAGF